MAESTVVANTNIVKETGYRYMIDGSGNVVKQNRVTKEKTTVVANAFTPEKGFFYFMTADGNVAKTVRVSRAKKEVPVAA